MQEAVKREVKEESGMDFEPEALLAVECHAHSWVRFTLGGRIVGGALKTPAQADRESLQAQWQSVDRAELLQTVRQSNLTPPLIPPPPSVFAAFTTAVNRCYMRASVQCIT